jgi:hypothetical protein
VSTPLVLFNATLSAVNAAGSAPDYDRDAAVGSSKWTGSERVFWVEAQERISFGDQSDVALMRHLLVDPALAVAFTTGDIVTVTRDDASSTETGRVQHVATAGSAITGTVTRLILENE